MLHNYVNARQVPLARCHSLLHFDGGALHSNGSYRLSTSTLQWLHVCVACGGRHPDNYFTFYIVYVTTINFIMSLFYIVLSL